jgi:hypothetical protein
MRNRATFTIKIAGAGLASMLAFAAVSVAGAASATTVILDSMDDIFLAGQSTVPVFPHGAGLLPVSLDVSAGEALTISASGLTSCGPDPTPFIGPNGLGGSSSIAGYGNVAAYLGNPFPLVGVFGGPSVSTPWSIFVIGSHRRVVVPTGATELYLGIPDAVNFNGAPGAYDDNTGSLTLEIQNGVVPEPAAWALMLVGFGGLGAALRRMSSRGPIGRFSLARSGCSRGRTQR